MAGTRTSTAAGGPTAAGAARCPHRTRSAWTWPVPDAARAAVGTVLLAAIAMPVHAALGHSYRAVTRAAAAGCASLTLLDVTMIIVVLGLSLRPGWLVAVAMTTSGLRIVHNVQGLPRLRAGR